MRIRTMLAVVASTGLIVGGVSIEARQPAAPPAPTMLPASVVEGLVGLSWVPSAAGPAPTAYQIQAGRSPGQTDIAVLTVPANPTVFATVAPAGIYYVRLIAFNGAVASPASNEIIVVVAGPGACLPPGVPTGLTATVAGGSVTLRWNAAIGGGPPNGFFLLVGSVAGGVNLGTFALGVLTTISSPAPPGQYFVRVVATNACGNSAPGNEASFVIGGGGLALNVPAGIYQGTIANHSRFGLPPLTSFTLQLNQPVPAASAFQMISGRWSDNRGCVRTNGIFGATSAAGPQLSIESLPCNDGDFGLRITAVNGNVYTGVCLFGGPSCTFRMTRQP